MAAMQPESLDILEKAHVPPEQARAFVSAMRIEINRATDILATKHDVGLVRHDVELVRHEMAEMRQGLEFKIEGLRGGLETKIEGLRGDLETKIEGLRGGLETKIEGLRGDLRSEIHQTASNITRQMYAAIFGSMTFLVGMAYLFVTHLRN
jgi:hypothetical protein